jgi:15-cis-phytoene synthase/lycopene beta-cyclase
VSVWKADLSTREAFFFLVTNTLIVLGQVGFDHAMAILHAHPAEFPDVPELPPPALLLRALRLPEQQYDRERVKGIIQASKRLERKSRSFHLASATFQGRLRIDLILL